MSRILEHSTTHPVFVTLLIWAKCSKCFNRAIPSTMKSKDIVNEWPPYNNIAFLNPYGTKFYGSTHYNITASAFEVLCIAIRSSALEQ